jgi:hypothetical protein
MKIHELIIKYIEIKYFVNHHFSNEISHHSISEILYGGY